MKRISFSVVAPFLLGLSLCACGSASAQGGHAQPNTGGGPPGGGNAGQIVGEAVAIYGQATTTTPGATVVMSEMANTDNEGATDDNGTAHCVSTPDIPGGSFDYTTTLSINNPTPDATNVAWSVPLSVRGYINYAKGSANSTSTLGTVGPTDSCGGLSSYGSAPTDSQTPSGLTPVAAYRTVPIYGVATGSSFVGS